jgi:hypothetical protein
MNMANYCKQKGMNLEQYKQFETNVNSAASAIYKNSEAIHKHGTGVYWPVNDIMDTVNGITETGYFIMDSLKRLGMEFITEENCIYYRA